MGIVYVLCIYPEQPDISGEILCGFYYRLRKAGGNSQSRRMSSYGKMPTVEGEDPFNCSRMSEQPAVSRDISKLVPVVPSQSGISSNRSDHCRITTPIVFHTTGALVCGDVVIHVTLSFAKTSTPRERHGQCDHHRWSDGDWGGFGSEVRVGGV